MSKHTNGPWHWTENGRLEPVAARSRSIAVILNSDGCMVYRDAPAGWEDERAANLALIAAAPELLEALDKLLEYASIRSDWLANGHSEPDDHPISIARAAIAKAKGEQ